jgi:L-asparagine oxygenase
MENDMISDASTAASPPPRVVFADPTASSALDPAIDLANVFCLTNRERDNLKQILGAIRYDDSGSEDYLAYLRTTVSRSLPDRVVLALHKQRSSLEPRPYLIIENLPTDDEVFGSPAHGEMGRAHKSGMVSENLALSIAVLIGEPYSINFEGADIVNNLTPEKSNTLDYTGLGSGVELDFHIENAALKFHSDLNLAPTGLLLTGVRQDPARPMTRFADGRRAVELLSDSDRDLLRSANYRLRVPFRWRSAFSSTGTIQTNAVPLISGCRRLPEVHAAFYPDMVQALSPEAERAFQHFYEAIKSVSFGIDVCPGRLVYADNRFTLHSRDRFTAEYDENGRPMRWVQRVFVASSLWPHRMLLSVKGRVFQPIDCHG